eukprot:3940633-Rhodomonas_salina.1
MEMAYLIAPFGTPSRIRQEVRIGHGIAGEQDTRITGKKTHFSNEFCGNWVALFLISRALVQTLRKLGGFVSDFACT